MERWEGVVALTAELAGKVEHFQYTTKATAATREDAQHTMVAQACRRVMKEFKGDDDVLLDAKCLYVMPALKAPSRGSSAS
jgi:hypothetical protein